MRTTIEISDDHRAILRAIAARRGWQGYSRVVEEAIEFYLRHHRATDDARRAMADRKGDWSDKEVDQARETIAELRERWSPPSS
ncbi:MAG: hypothetical protein ABEK03_10105 [Candidatus Bipolaricaulia bacterium]